MRSSAETPLISRATTVSTIIFPEPPTTLRPRVKRDSMQPSVPTVPSGRGVERGVEPRVEPQVTPTQPIPPPVRPDIPRLQLKHCVFSPDSKAPPVTTVRLSTAFEPTVTAVPPSPVTQLVATSKRLLPALQPGRTAVVSIASESLVAQVRTWHRSRAGEQPVAEGSPIQVSTWRTRIGL